MSERPQHAGDPGHPHHQEFILELGRATYAAAKVAGICFDLARVLGGVASADMYSDPLGALINRLRPLATSGVVDGLADFIGQLETARDSRNDLIHALPVRYGLHRRKTPDPSYVRNFFDIEDLAAVTTALESASRRGSELLYADGGAAVRAWYEAS